jgi:hypothetical protein
MNRLSLAFFTAGALCALGGMIWGAYMGATEDFTLSPAHAHLNLVGWATLALMGTFYAVAGKAGRLGWLNFGLSTLGVVLMIPSLALYLRGDSAAQSGLMAGTLATILGMLAFVASVLSHWGKAKPASA